MTASPGSPNPEQPRSEGPVPLCRHCLKRHRIPLDCGGPVFAKALPEDLAAAARDRLALTGDVTPQDLICFYGFTADQVALHGGPAIAAAYRARAEAWTPNERRSQGDAA